MRPGFPGKGGCEPDCILRLGNLHPSGVLPGFDAKDLCYFCLELEDAILRVKDLLVDHKFALDPYRPLNFG